MQAGCVVRAINNLHKLAALALPATPPPHTNTPLTTRADQTTQTAPPSLATRKTPLSPALRSSIHQARGRADRCTKIARGCWSLALSAAPDEVPSAPAPGPVLFEDPFRVRRGRSQLNRADGGAKTTPWIRDFAMASWVPARRGGAVMILCVLAVGLSGVEAFMPLIGEGVGLYRAVGGCGSRACSSKVTRQIYELLISAEPLHGLMIFCCTRVSHPHLHFEGHLGLPIRALL